jgi:hypothetical protein
MRWIRKSKSIIVAAKGKELDSFYIDHI